MAKISNFLKKLFWKFPMPLKLKVKIRSLFPQNKDVEHVINKANVEICSNQDLNNNYVKQILEIPEKKSNDHKDFIQHDSFQSDFILCSFYLTQFHPTEKNNLWWGRGTTEWNNVSKAVPQFIDHYQPRLPGELGFYDLRIVDNMRRQVELAKNYGINAFCFYYYWFNGERALELPLNNFLKNQDIDIKFCLCWCNEDWTKRYSGVCSDVLLSVGKSESSYIAFINEVCETFNDKRYLKIKDKFVLLVYRPSLVPNCKKTIGQWRQIVKERTGCDLYLIASQEAMIDKNWLKEGFDAISQFQPASCISKAVEITNRIEPIRKDFNGHIFDYKEMVNKGLFVPDKKLKIYPSVMPMWDNTARRNNSGNIFHGSTPDLYCKSLSDALSFVNNSRLLDAKLVFINAWNEWAEGAYLEPDRFFGYAYLEATYTALNNLSKEK